MSLTTGDPNLRLTHNSKTFEEAKSLRTNLVWQELNKITVAEALEHWLVTLSSQTQATYRYGMKMLIEIGLIDPMLNLQGFSLVNHDTIIDRIKLIKEWAECSCQARAACYISFTRFLSRRTQGIIPRAIPNREGSSKTFFRVYEKVKTAAMTQAQWIKFFEALENINSRDCLIAKIILQGGKRLSEVLTLKTDQIDWVQLRITFTQSKTKGLLRETVITYPDSVMQKLRNFIGDRVGLVFVTRFGKSVGKKQLANTFAKAGKQAGIHFKITPHVLRASTVTYLKQQGFADSDIMKITGHANSAMVHAYDKSSRVDNASAKISLIS